MDVRTANSALRNRLVGRPCLKTTVNVETGADLLLHIGKWIRYAKQSERLRIAHRGELMLMISCPWQIHGPGGRVVESSDVHDHESWRTDQSVLEGLSIRDVLLTAPSWDLTVRFEGGFHLEAFCEAGQQPDNWFLLGPDSSELAVGPDCDLQFQD